MADLWDQVAGSLYEGLGSQLWRLRETEEFKALDSEIERAMAAWFVLTMRMGNLPHQFAKVPKADCGFYLVPQYEIGKYRVDFAFGHSKNNFELRRSIAIECDGHDWHEKTKEQAARDKKRDRFLQQQFGAVLHFTGSEIYRDVDGCFGEIMETMSAIWKRSK